MRKGKDRWEQVQGNASPYVSEMFLKEASLRTVERRDAVSGSICKQVMFLLFSVCLLFWTQCIISSYPPQVSKFLCKNRRIRGVSKRSQKAFVELILHRPLSVSAVKKILSCPSWVFMVYHKKVHDTPTTPSDFRHWSPENTFCRNNIFSLNQISFLNCLIHERNDGFSHTELAYKYVQMYFRPIYRHDTKSNQGISSRNISALGNEWISSQKRGNDKNKPKPDEKKPEPRPDKKKPEPKPGERKPERRREGDRQPREPRDPNAKGRGHCLQIA